MKNIALSLLAAITIATPAYAWKNELFTKLDADTNGEIAFAELTATGCRVDTKLFNYADTDRSSGLNKSEFFTNRELFRRCK